MSDVVPRETVDRLNRYLALLIEANVDQNLVSARSLEHGWERHIIDSAQLRPLVRGSAVDVGSGAGLPGLVLAIMGCRMTLVEPRKKRHAFLVKTAAALGLVELRVVQQRAEHVSETFDTITARALAPLDRLLALTYHLAGKGTRWVLPKGNSVHAELAQARRSWHGEFELVPSITDPSGMIVVAENVMPRARS